MKVMSDERGGPMNEVEKLKQLAAEAALDAADFRAGEIAKDIYAKLKAAFPEREFGISSKDGFDTWHAVALRPSAKTHE
jgi:hypothetical protein